MDMDILIACTKIFKEKKRKEKKRKEKKRKEKNEDEDEIGLLSERLIATFPSVGKFNLQPIK